MVASLSEGLAAQHVTVFQILSSASEGISRQPPKLWFWNAPSQATKEIPRGRKSNNYSPGGLRQNS
jgi:hypothetical protein